MGVGGERVSCGAGRVGLGRTIVVAVRAGGRWTCRGCVAWVSPTATGGGCVTHRRGRVYKRVYTSEFSEETRREEYMAVKRLEARA